MKPRRSGPAPSPQAAARRAQLRQRALEAGRFLRRQREGLGLSQDQVSLATGIPASSLSAWECGRHMVNGLDYSKLRGFYNARRAGLPRTPPGNPSEGSTPSA